MTVLIQPD